MKWLKNFNILLAFTCFSATLVVFSSSVYPIWQKNLFSARDKSTREARVLLGFFHQSIAGEDPIAASRSDLVTISKEKIPTSIVVKPFINNILPIDLFQGPLIQLKGENDVCYITAMADIAKRVLTLVDYQQKRKEDNGFRIFDFQNSISRDALDDLILDRDYTNLCVEFCSAFKALDKAKRFLKGPYFKLDGDSNFEDEDIYSWREIALRILDYLVVASPNIENYNAGKAIVKKVLEDMVVAKIVKQQFLQALNIENFQVRNYDNIDNYIKASIPNKGLINIFGELSSEDQYDLVGELIQLNFKKIIASEQSLFPNERLHFTSIIQSFENPKMLHRLANINDQESKVLGLKLINLISSPLKTDHRQHFWFWSYLTVDFLLSDKNSTFCKFFEKEITNSNLIEKIKLFKRITTLNKRAISLSPEKIIEKYRFEHLEATEVWKQLAEDRLIKWFYALWDQQNELEKDFKILREDLETHSLNSKKYISEAGHSNIKHGEFLSAELGYWINTETISKLQKALKPKLAPNIQMILQQAVLQRAAIKNSSLIEYLDYKFNIWFGWNFGKNVLLKKILLIGSSELRGKVSKS